MTGRVLGMAVAVLAMAGPAFADSHDPQGAAVWSAQMCLEASDQGFEQSLNDDLAEADRAALVSLYERATYACLGLAMEVCEGRDAPEACLGVLSDWVEAERARIVATLPAEISDENALLAQQYGPVLERAAAPADDTQCAHLSDADRTRYCDVIAQGVALADAYEVWRMARRVGEVPLEGHGPVDLELIR